MTQPDAPDSRLSVEQMSHIRKVADTFDLPETRPHDWREWDYTDWLVKTVRCVDALTADLARVEAERDRLRQDRDAFRNLAERYQIEHNREWDQGACQCPRCQPFHDLFMASLRADGNVRKALTAEPARAEEGASDEQ